MAAKVANNHKQDTRTALLNAGMTIMLEKGYNNTGIQEVLNSLGVPKGSFYHYFDSKEDFGLAIIEYFDCGFSSKVLTAFANAELTPLARLRAYYETTRENLSANDCRKGCLIGNLSQEMADQSETLRHALCDVMAKWRDLFATCIAEGQATGEISPNFPPDRMAELLLSSWEGAVMRAKTTKNIEPIDVFIELMFEQVLKA